MTYTIRQATPDDLESIIELIRHGFAPAVQEILILEIVSAIRDHTFTSFVALSENTVIGHARIHYLGSDRAHFGSLVVHEEQRNKGIATALSAARTAYLRKNNFQGIAYSDAVTLHPYSQQQLSAAGFFPTRVLLGSLPDHGSGPETCVGFAQLFSPVGLWKPASTELSLYLPLEYRAIATETLRPLGNAHFREDTIDEAGLRTKSFVAAQNPETLYPVRLYEPTAPADIALLQSRGYVIAGFSPVLRDGTVSAVAYMYKIPAVALHRNQIKTIPAAQRLFDFVWQQYETR